MAVTGKTFTELTNQQQVDMRIAIRGYKAYKVLLSQTGTTAPNAIILENTLDWDPTWSYIDVGWYRVSNWPHDIDQSKIFVIGGNRNRTRYDSPSINGTISFYSYKGDYRFEWRTSSNNAYTGLGNSLGAYYYLEIRMYL